MHKSVQDRLGLVLNGPAAHHKIRVWKSGPVWSFSFLGKDQDQDWSKWSLDQSCERLVLTSYNWLYIVLTDKILCRYAVLCHGAPVGMCGTVHITRHDHTDVTKATHCKNTCWKCIKTLFLWCFCKDCCRYYYVIKTSLGPVIGPHWTRPMVWS